MLLPDFIYWSIRSPSRMGEDGVEGVDGSLGGVIILACCKFHFIREHENLVLPKQISLTVKTLCSYLNYLFMLAEKTLILTFTNYLMAKR